ncbi:MAG: ATP-dependent zinc protease [Gammaproteobacteria bacterium]|nr:ATP-dependent zinc protease [Gammaproteobacteria bacterium]MBT6042280.1 ATP-dependent zinc protease [Gammaproteobacteria bacterium]
MFSKLKVGALELCELPELGINDLHIRVDTGATTSSLHVDNIEEFSKNGKNWVSFDLHPDIHNVKRIVRTTVRIKGRKKVKSSSADTEKRVVITTPILLGGQEWPIKLTLTDRSEMTYLMLLGREAMQGRILVDPEFEYLLAQDETGADEDLLDNSEEE